MSADNLDTLPDCELDRLFALEIAGYRPATDPFHFAVGWVVHPDSWDEDSWPPPSFCDSPQHVTPYLDRYQWQLTRWNGGRDGEPAMYWINLPMGHPDSVEAEAPTFARAAVIALLRATCAGHKPGVTS